MDLSNQQINSGDESENDTTALLGDVHGSVANNKPLKVHFPSCRLVLAFMSFLGFVNVYCLRVNLSVALVAMVNQTNDFVVNGTNKSSTEDCPVDIVTVNASDGAGNHHGELNWNSHVQGTVLAAFFYGYITTQVPGGWLAERFGGKVLYGCGILTTSLLTLLTPLAARWDVRALIALRVLEGIGEGVTFPAMHALLAQWIPPWERSRAGTFVYAGAQLGTVVGMPLSGVLCDHGFAGGWPSVFYVFGIAGCVWSLAWFFLCYNSPSEHPRIASAERHYIETALGSHRDHHPKPSTPWCKILTSAPVLSLTLAHFANNWGFYTLLTCLPKYLNDVLHFDVTKNGILSGLPYLASWLIMTGGGQLADWMRAPTRLSTGTVRKIFCTVGLILPGVFLVIIGFLGCNHVAVVTALILSVGCSGLTMSGYGVNHLDLSPAHAGTLLGLTNMVATIPGIMGPQVVGALTYLHSSRSQWQIVFYITTCIYCVGAVVFLLFGSGNQQDWAKPAEEDSENDTADIRS